VEEFILDRTLDPAIAEFGVKGFRMIDPACGSGHFLLGSFRRLLDCWQRKEPGTNMQELVQRSLDSVHGVDVI
jgi:type I restriction-modification system DNA methylase subunit